MMQPIEFYVHGIPQPAGSKRPFIFKRKGTAGIERGHYGASVVDANPKAASWKTEVKNAALQVFSGPLLTGALRLDITFFMPRPKYHYRSGARSAELKDNAPENHITTPDRTKLTRGTEDALTGIIWRDDTQIVDGRLIKIYDDGRGPGCKIRITEA